MTEYQEFGMYLLVCYSVMGLMFGVGWWKRRSASRTQLPNIEQGDADAVKPIGDSPGPRSDPYSSDEARNKDSSPGYAKAENPFDKMQADRPRVTHEARGEENSGAKKEVDGAGNDAVPQADFPTPKSQDWQQGQNS